MNIAKQSCPVCGTEVVQPQTGRPKRFCSDACRWLKKTERRRLENLIVQLEGEARPLRHAARRGATSLASMSPDFYGRDLEQQLEDAERDIASARQRLAAILADEPP